MGLSNFERTARDLISRRHLLRRILLAAGIPVLASRFTEAGPVISTGLDPRFLEKLRNCLPEDTLFFHAGISFGSMRELTGGDLLHISTQRRERTLSRDGGKSWDAPQPLLTVSGETLKGEGRPEGGNPSLLQLESGGLALVYSKKTADPAHNHTVWFSRSDDGAASWSPPRKISEPYNNAWKFHNSAIVTSRGRIVVPVFTLVGKSLKERGRALFDDGPALIGHHGWEEFFAYCWAYYSDDEGRTWKTNTGKGVWAAGGELFATVDHSSGGHYQTTEPSVVEVAPDHLLMLLRTPLGRLYQSWSEDDGASWSRPEPSPVASALAPPAVERIPGTHELLLVWNQSSAEEIRQGLQRHRLSSAISRDGGASWESRPNVFSTFQKADGRIRIEPPPIRFYRARERASRLPPNDLEGTYPSIAFWKDTVLVSFMCRERSYYSLDSEGRTGYDHLPGQRGTTTHVCVALPLSRFRGGAA